MEALVVTPVPAPTQVTVWVARLAAAQASVLAMSLVRGVVLVVRPLAVSEVKLVAA
jgi:hypothetical protein